MLARLWTWAKKDPVQALTLGGLVVYALLRLPYAVYYGSLGSAPEDVGLGYLDTLARSTAGLTAAAVAVGVAAATLGLLWTFVLLYGRMAWGALRVRGLSRKPFSAMDDDEYATERAKATILLTTMFRGERNKVETLLAESDLSRSLQMLGVRDAQQQATIDELRARKAFRMMVDLVSAEASRVARKAGAWGATLTLLAIVVSLPVVAYRDANEVRACRAPLLGRFGLFAIRGASSDVYRVGEDGATVAMLQDRHGMYLGSADDTLVLFDCKGGRVVRLPAADVLVAST